MRKKTNDSELIKPEKGELFDRVVSILEQARTNVVRSVNSNMVIAYWLIGREIVQEFQRGEDRAEYGKKLIEDLSAKLREHYGKGFSTTNLRYFRLFYQTFSDRSPEIRHMLCDESKGRTGKRQIHHKACDVLNDLSLAIEKSDSIRGFSPALSWSHYRTLTKVKNQNERLFYEIESLHESRLEAAIIDNLQAFLLELGKGFAFVDRQHRVATESQHFYVDLMFYNYLLKCFVLIDLKIGKLTPQDIGQMDMYVRMFDELRRGRRR